MPVLPNSLRSGLATDSGTPRMSQVGYAPQSTTFGPSMLEQSGSRLTLSQAFRYVDRTNSPPEIKYPNANQDWRVRISLAPGADYFYKDPNNFLLSPLVNQIGDSLGGQIVNNLTNTVGLSGKKRIGVVYPYTPQITVTHVASYSDQKLTHSNYTNYFYDSSAVQAISIAGEFTVQNVNEGQYLLATIHFFRSVTKMFFGGDPDAGTPPPIVYLNGYGQYYLPNVPCIVTSFAHTMPADVDYIEVPEPAATRTRYNPQSVSYRLNSTRLPTKSTVTLSLQPVYSRLSQSQGFSLRDFSKGALINSPFANGGVTVYGTSQGGQWTTGGGPGGFI
jgi:hypothetical protein